jgi:hypothetical protein
MAEPVLFLCEAELARRLGIGERRWRQMVPQLEREGLPRKDPAIGRRFWPAVETFFAGRATQAAVASATVDDGGEAAEHW